MTRIGLIILSAIVAVGCASTTTSAAPAAAAAAPEAAAVPGPPQVAWADMSKANRASYMKAVVMPAMKAEFVAFDKRFEDDFTCATCHGGGAKDKSFKMPTADIYQLPNSQEGWGALMKEKPEWMKFMGGHVKPTMAKLLGKAEFDPANPTVPNTVSCMTCHMTKS